MPIPTRLFAALLAIAFTTTPAFANDNANDAPFHIHMISGSAEYESEPSLRQLQQSLEDDDDANFTVTASWARDEGTDLPDIHHLADADLLIVFTRRMTVPDDQLQYVRDHVTAERPVIGIRTASHAFQDYLEMDADVFGGDYDGHGPDEPTDIALDDNHRDHPVLDGVDPWSRPGKIYHNPQLAPDAQPLLHATGQNTGIREPVAWTHRFGDAGRAFYTSLGFPHDFDHPNFQTLLRNAIQWAGQINMENDD